MSNRKAPLYDKMIAEQKKAAKRQRAREQGKPPYVAGKIDVNDYQKDALRTIGQISTSDKILQGALGIAGESGEVVDLVKKWKYHGHNLDIDNLETELGDILFYIAILADAAGISFNTLLVRNMNKRIDRYPDGFDPDRSKNREA